MWQSLLISLLARVVAAIIGAQDWAAILATVQAMADREISGAEKRRLALVQLDEMRRRTGDAAVHFGIEAAVQWLRLRQ